MTLEEAIQHAEEVAETACVECADNHRQLAAWLRDYKRLLGQEPCEDAISRQAAIEKIHWLGLDNDTAIKCDLAIRALPSIKPQEPPKHTKCDRCPYGETRVVNICNYDGDGCGWD